MADYIRDEEEQAERIKEWWQKNGTAAIIVVVLAVGSLIGWRQWEGHSASKAGEASQVYDAMLGALQEGGDPGQARDAADTLIEDHGGSSYADYARLLLARLAVGEGDLDGAVEQLSAVADDPATQELEYTARLRLARVLMEQQELEAAEEQLSRSFPEAWQGQALELKGDIASSREQWDAARDAYGDALEALNDGAARDRVQMKLDDVKPLT